MPVTIEDNAESSGLPTKQVVGLILGPLLFLLTVMLPAPADMSVAAWSALGLMLLMAIWWSTEAIPIPATALLPIVLVPALGLGTIKSVTAPYANPIIFLFLGGFALGLAMQRCHLHRRIALKILLAVGAKPQRQIAGFMIATAFLSMWVSNTATTIMMLPIGLSVIAMLDPSDSDAVRRYATALMLAIAYAASIGGVGTLIGTPPNALLAAYLNETQGISVGFAQWMLLGVPLSLIMLAVIWWWLVRKDFGLAGAGIPQGLIREELAALGPLRKGERRVAAIFLVTAAAWISRPLLSKVGMPWLSDTGIAIASALALFLTPEDLRVRRFLLDWETAKGIPWGVLLLFGGGLALADVINHSGLADWIASSLSVVGHWPLIGLIALVVSVVIFLTEVTSNTATAATFLPLLGALALSQGLPAVMLTVPACIAASCAFMMPVATPPNAIVFASGHLAIEDMIRTGFVLNLLGIVVVTGLSYLMLGFVLRF